MLLFQDLVEGAQIGSEVAEEKTLSVIDLIVNGGVGSVVIIAILFVMLFIALYIYFERIFAIKAASKIDKNSSGGQAEMGSLASGIYTAMTTTVAGLVVGIIAYIGYNHLVNRTDKVIHKMEANAVDFLDLLNEPL